MPTNRKRPQPASKEGVNEHHNVRPILPRTIEKVEWSKQSQAVIAAWLIAFELAIFVCEVC